MSDRSITRRALLAFSSVAFALTMCPKVFSAQEQITLNFSHILGDASPTAPALAAGIARFEEKYPNVTVVQNLTSQAEYMTQFQVGAASGDVPDVFMMHGSFTRGLVDRGLVSPVTEEFYADPEWGGITPPEVMFEFIRDGEVYGVAYASNTAHFIYWNQEIFARAGIEEFPSNWDDFLVAIDKLNEIGVTPLNVGDKGKWMVVNCHNATLTARTYGGTFVADVLSGETDFMDPAFISSVEHYKELIDHKAFNPNFSSLDNFQQRDAYYRGEAAMFIEGGWMIPILAADAPKEILEVTGMATWPTVDGLEENAGFISGGSGWAYSISSKLEGAQREAAINLLREISSIPYSRDLLKIGLHPAQDLGDSANDIEVLPMLRKLMDNLADGTWEIIPLTGTNFPSSYLSTASLGYQGMMTGGRTPLEVAQLIQADYERW